MRTSSAGQSSLAVGSQVPPSAVGAEYCFSPPTAATTRSLDSARHAPWKDRAVGVRALPGRSRADKWTRMVIRLATQDTAIKRQGFETLASVMQQKGITQIPIAITKTEDMIFG
ncbi:hypothetical protein SS50377_21792 [Spironucleus salmonicida]|uniref:Uncharacterized protein n=1 Tax=Spironucleus salmonicida TaxID=348837 RepID=A0A9P8S0Z0_9EUKA|nr:hypothetical protein SS50377_21792 [Spironucleus salmonicida]